MTDTMTAEKPKAVAIPRLYQAADPAAFDTWLRTANPGEQFAYVTGKSLWFPEKVHEDGKWVIRQTRPKVADDAWDAYRDGLVTLAQKRLSTGKDSLFAYIAVQMGAA